MAEPAALQFDPKYPLLGIAAWSGTGKTTLLESLLPLLCARGMRVAVIKHAHHAFEVDQPGKDSHRLRVAGACPMLVASRNRFALMMETPGREEPDLGYLIDSLYCHEPDLILVEGFKAWPLPRLVLYRTAVGSDRLTVQDGWVRAVASDCLDQLALGGDVARLELDDIAQVADWVVAWPNRWKDEISQGACPRQAHAMIHGKRSFHRDETAHSHKEGDKMPLTHLNAQGEANMVDVGDKAESRREAVASGRITMQPATLALLAEGGLPKGDVLATARIAGIQAAKRTHELIPLCHSLALSKVAVDFTLDSARSCVDVQATCRLDGRTGVEMEALTAVSVACLTLYDMCKAVDKGMRIDAIQLESKQGGKSGDYRRDFTHAVEPIVTGEGATGEVSLGQRCSSPCVRIKFLAELRERLGTNDIVLSLDSLPRRDVAGLKAALVERDTRFSLLNEERVLCAVNQVMANDSARVTDDDEVAFFPPVTGG